MITYKRVDNIRAAERLHARGWKVIQSSPFSEVYLLEKRTPSIRRKKKAKR